jgi:hypothetical protein
LVIAIPNSSTVHLKEGLIMPKLKAPRPARNKTLEEQKTDFTAEGAPPPATVTIPIQDSTTGNAAADKQVPVIRPGTHTHRRSTDAMPKARRERA